MREVQVRTVFADDLQRNKFLNIFEEILFMGSIQEYTAELNEMTEGKTSTIWKFLSEIDVDTIRQILAQSGVDSLDVFCPNESVERRQNGKRRKRRRRKSAKRKHAAE